MIATAEFPLLHRTSMYKKVFLLFFLLLQITMDVVQIIDNVTRWPVSVTNGTASMYVFTLEHMVALYDLKTHCLPLAGS